MKIYLSFFKNCNSWFKYLFLLVALGGAQAAPVNLLVNGSFESGLSGWTVTGSFSSVPVMVIVTDGVTGSAYGEAVPADNIVGGSPDAAGMNGVYFVDDNAHQVLSQSSVLSMGNYEIGFDAYAPLNGFNNPGDATFIGTIAGISLASYTVKTQNAAQQWINYSAILNVLANGIYNVTFDFQTLGGASADVVIDRVYIVASEQGGGTVIQQVPEPGTFALLSLGLLGLGLSGRRRIADRLIPH